MGALPSRSARGDESIVGEKQSVENDRLRRQNADLQSELARLHRAESPGRGAKA
jgi:hypothetical protein